MSDRRLPRVCANCEWAELDVLGHKLRCHRYPPTEAGSQFNDFIHPAEWCGEFVAATNRPMRYDLPYPSCQEARS